MPLGKVVSAHTPYHTLVLTAGLAATLVFAKVSAPELLEGTFAKVVEFMATFV